MDYRKLYLAMVNGAEKAIRAIEEQNYGLAKQLLIAAEREAEEQYLREEEAAEEAVPAADLP